MALVPANSAVSILKPNLSSASQWYRQDAQTSSVPTDNAFKEALAIFKTQLTRDPKKKRRIDEFQKYTLNDVLERVSEAQKLYCGKHRESKVGRCITKFAQRVQYYGRVLDVMAQHHPEYVSLAWGAMKLLFGAIVEHENIGSVIVTGLVDVADALPRIELTTVLYPTAIIKHAATNLHAHIIRFLLRALEWYEEGILKNILHSVTKPAALRYDDIITDIEKATHNLESLAISSSQAEQRDIHLRLHNLQRDLEASTAISQAQRLDIDLKLGHLTDSFNDLKLVVGKISYAFTNQIGHQSPFCGIKREELLQILPSMCNVDHESSLKAAQVLRDRHRLIAGSRSYPFWLSSQMRAWNLARNSSLILLKTSIRNRHHVRNFGVNIIEQLKQDGASFVWAFQDEREPLDIIHILKSLISQIIAQESLLNIQPSLGSHVRGLSDNCNEDEYFSLLESCLESLNFSLHVVIEAAHFLSSSVIRFQSRLQHILNKLNESNTTNIVKVIIMVYGPLEIPSDNESLVLKVRETSRRKGHKIPTSPLRQGVRGQGPTSRRGQRASGVQHR